MDDTTMLGEMAPGCGGRGGVAPRFLVSVALASSSPDSSEDALMHMEAQAIESAVSSVASECRRHLCAAPSALRAVLRERPDALCIIAHGQHSVTSGVLRGAPRAHMPFVAGGVQEYDAAALVAEVAESIADSGKPWLVMMSSCHSSWFAARLARELPADQMPVMLAFASLVQGALCAELVPGFLRGVLGAMASASQDLPYDAWLGEARLAAHAAFCAVTQDLVEHCWALVDPSDEAGAGTCVERGRLGGVPLLVMRVPSSSEGDEEEVEGADDVVPTDAEVAAALDCNGAPEASAGVLSRAGRPDSPASVPSTLLEQLSLQSSQAVAAAAAAGSGAARVVDGGGGTVRVVPFEADFCVRERSVALVASAAGCAPEGALEAVRVRALLAVSMPLHSDPASTRSLGHAVVASWVLRRVLFNDRAITPEFPALVFASWPSRSDHAVLQDALRRRLVGAALADADADFAKPSGASATPVSAGQRRRQEELVVMTREQMELLLAAAAAGRAAHRSSAGGSAPSAGGGEALGPAWLSPAVITSPCSGSDPSPPQRSAVAAVAAVYRARRSAGSAGQSEIPSTLRGGGGVSAPSLRAQPPPGRRGGSSALVPLPRPGASPCGPVSAPPLHSVGVRTLCSAPGVVAAPIVAEAAAAAAPVGPPSSCPLSLAVHAQIAQGPDYGSDDGGWGAAPGLEVDVLVRATAASRAGREPGTLSVALVALVDCGSAMDAAVAAAGGKRPRRSRLDAVREALLVMLARLRPCDHFGLVAFAGEVRDARVVFPLQELTEGAPEAARRAIDAGLSTSPGAYIYAGVCAAHKELKRYKGQRGHSAIALFAASRESHVAPDDAYAGLTTQLFRERVAVHTLGCSSDAPISMLAALASKTGGAYLAVPEAGDDCGAPTSAASPGLALLTAADALVATLTSAVTPNLKLRMPVQPPLLRVSGVGSAYLHWPPGLAGNTGSAEYAAGVDFGLVAAGESRDVLLRVRLDASALQAAAGYRGVTLQLACGARVGGRTAEGNCSLSASVTVRRSTGCGERLEFEGAPAIRDGPGELALARVEHEAAAALAAPADAPARSALLGNALHRAGFVAASAGVAGARRMERVAALLRGALIAVASPRSEARAATARRVAGAAALGQQRWLV